MEIIAEKISKWVTWGKISIFVIILFCGFSTYVAGTVIGARSLEPKVDTLTEKVNKHDSDMKQLALNSELIKHDLRIVSLEKGQKEADLKTAEIIGYLKAIASNLGVDKSEIRIKE